MRQASPRHLTKGYKWLRREGKRDVHVKAYCGQVFERGDGRVSRTLKWTRCVRCLILREAELRRMADAVAEDISYFRELKVSGQLGKHGYKSNFIEASPS